MQSLLSPPSGAYLCFSIFIGDVQINTNCKQVSPKKGAICQFSYELHLATFKPVNSLHLNSLKNPQLSSANTPAAHAKEIDGGNCPECTV